jgi:hypothetical protein
MAAESVLFLGFNKPNPGVRNEAYAFLAGEGMGYLRSLEGKWFERMEMVALTAHGGDLNGCIVLHGERAKLDELRRTDEFEAFAMKMSELWDGFGAIPGLNWAGIQKAMKRTGLGQK